MSFLTGSYRQGKTMPKVQNKMHNTDSLTKRIFLPSVTGKNLPKQAYGNMDYARQKKIRYNSAKNENKTKTNLAPQYLTI